MLELRRVVLLLVVLIGALLSFVAPAAADIFYLYDDLGRLIAVVDPEGNAATYTYDEVGNLRAIQRIDAGTSLVGITLVTPNRGRVGTQVSIFGKGFSATAAQNTVTFNGTAATVTEAAPNRITTSVPAGATTGLISVTSPLGTATSPTPFTVAGAMAVEPAGAAVLAGARQQFQATEGGSPTADVTWAVNGITEGDTTIGTISASGLYMAPATILGSTGTTTVTVTATHRDDRQASGSASVTVIARTAFFSAVSVALAAYAPGRTVNQNVGSSLSVQVAESPALLVAGGPVAAAVAESGTQFVGAGAVAATVAPVITGRSPASAAPGTNLAITVTGSGFTGATGLSFLLATGADSNISVTNLQVNPDGTEATAQVSILSGAVVGGRVIQITTPGGASTRAGTGGNVFNVQ
ncbi:MAG TPA: IPT/TIG domain-containing protein [Methylomirabilota bacterium]|jgi:YD repeat-containing protein|nr:IPT/TIG domain-containing protein [Methylomirabilota bacterium]